MEQYEMSYVDILTKLHDDIEADIIPKSEKEEIMQLIYMLQEKLWKYSA